MTRSTSDLVAQQFSTSQPQRSVVVFLEKDTDDIPIIFMTVTIELDKDKGKESIEIYGRQYRAFAKPLHNRKLLSVIRKEINKRIHGNK